MDRKPGSVDMQQFAPKLELTDHERNVFRLIGRCDYDPSVKVWCVTELAVEIRDGGVASRIVAMDHKSSFDECCAWLRKRCEDDRVLLPWGNEAGPGTLCTTFLLRAKAQAESLKVEETRVDA